MPACCSSQDYYIQFLWPCNRRLSTHASAGDSWTLTGKSGSGTFGVTAPFSWVLVHTMFHLCPPRVFFPQSCGSSVVKPTGLQSQIPWGSHSFCQVPRLGIGRLFCSLWASAPWLCGGAHGNLLQKDLGYRLRLPGLLQPEPLSPWQATAESCLCRRHSNTQRQVWFSVLWGPWVLVCPRFCLPPLSISGGYEVWF